MLVKRWGETLGTGGLDDRTPKNGTVDRGDAEGGGYSGDRGDTGDGGEVWDRGDTGYGKTEKAPEA